MVRFTLVLVQRPSVTMELPTQGVFGRSSESDVQFFVPTVSRRHFSFSTDLETSELKISDLGSLNGVKVNGEKVSVGLVRDGDIIDLGCGVELQLVVDMADSDSVVPDAVIEG